MNAVSSEQCCSASMDLLRLAGTQICRGFKVHDLITCESRIQVAVSPESYTSKVNCNARTTCTNSSGEKPDFGLDQQ